MSLKNHLWSFKIILQDHSKPASVWGYSARPRRRRRPMAVTRKPARPGDSDSARAAPARHASTPVRAAATSARGRAARAVQGFPASRRAWLGAGRRQRVPARPKPTCQWPRAAGRAATGSHFKLHVKLSDVMRLESTEQSKSQAELRNHGQQSHGCSHCTSQEPKTLKSS